MPRKPRKSDHQSPLAVFLEQVIKEHGIPAKKIASDLGVSPSVLSAWRQGSYPASEQLSRLKTFANRFGRSLSQVLTGEMDEGHPAPLIEFDRVHLLDAICEIKIVRLLPKSNVKS
jgi:transcriptional regulator with XRE-family HTH domain